MIAAYLLLVSNIVQFGDSAGVVFLFAFYASLIIAPTLAMASWALAFYTRFRSWLGIVGAVGSLLGLIMSVGTFLSVFFMG